MKHADLIELAADWVAGHLDAEGGLDHPVLARAVAAWEAGHGDAGDYIEKG